MEQRGRVGDRKKSLDEVKTKALQSLYDAKEHSIGELCEMFDISGLVNKRENKKF